MRRFILIVGLGTSLLAAGACEGPRPPLTRAARAGDLDVIRPRLEDTFAARRALWFARFHGCTEVLAMVKG